MTIFARCTRPLVRFRERRHKEACIASPFSNLIVRLAYFLSPLAFHADHIGVCFFSGSLRNVPARKINVWPLHSVLRDKYEFSTDAAEEVDSFLRGVLALDPAERASAQEAVEHPWLWS